MKINSNAKIIYFLASNYIDCEKYDKAIEYLNKIITLTLNSSDAYFYLGVVYSKNKNSELAEKVFLKALELNPDNAKALGYLGYIYAYKGIKLNNAETFLVRAITLDPSNSWYIDSLAYLYYKQKKFTAAEKLLLSATNFVVDHIVFERLGDIYTVLNKIKEAWTFYALSYDFKQDKKIKKKLDNVRAKCRKRNSTNKRF